MALFYVTMQSLQTGATNPKRKGYIPSPFGVSRVPNSSNKQFRYDLFEFLSSSDEILQ
jgi:hypothetical protein